MGFISYCMSLSLYIMSSCLKRYSVLMNLILQMHAGQQLMCGVIVVDAGRSRSTNLGRDAYIHDHFLGYHHNYLLFYQFPNNNLFTHHMLFPQEKPLAKSTAPGLFSIIKFSDILYKNPRNTLLHFFFIYFILCFCQIYLSNLIQFNLSQYRGGIDNPSYALGCKYLLFVCRCCLHSVAWFSYWIDNLGFITVGNNYRCCTTRKKPNSSRA